MNSLEGKFNEKTPNWIVCLEDGWSISLPIKVGVRKFGKVTSVVQPDFAVLNENEEKIYDEIAFRKENGLHFLDPFSKRIIDPSCFIEVFGDYWHGEEMTGVPVEEHVENTKEAYESIGKKVLILWENEIHNHWEEVCVPKIDAFTKEIDCSKWETNGRGGALSECSLKSLGDASFFQSLGDEGKDNVVDELLDNYRKIGFPYIDRYTADYEFKKFIKWSQGSKKKGTRFGNLIIKHFIHSFFNANVNGCDSLWDLWNDDCLLRKSISWQLNNEKGVHNSNRFFNAVQFKNGFRAISNLNPSKAVQIIDNNFSFKKGDIYLDPCAGWGGRMLASHVLGLKYRAIDANKNLVDELNNMAKELGIDAKVLYGSSDDEGVYEELMGEDVAKVCFTSPPYFDKEIYSSDDKQSVVGCSSMIDWNKNFLSKTIINCKKYVDCEVVINMDETLMEDVVSKETGLGIDKGFVEMQTSKGYSREVLHIFRGNDDKIEGRDYVVCVLCNKRFRDLSDHVVKTHDISLKNYKVLFPNSKIFCDDTCAKKNNKGIKRKAYKKKIGYRCADGRIVYRRDAWEKSWSGCPPDDSIIENPNIDPYDGKKEGVDYVSCVVCGHKGRNIKRHVDGNHNIEEYSGEMICSDYLDKQKKGAMKNWNNPDRIRKRKEPRDKSLNKTHKVNGLTEDVLKKLYLKDGMSDAGIGRMFDMTGEGVAYRRKKIGISTRSRKR